MSTTSKTQREFVSLVKQARRKGVTLEEIALRLKVSLSSVSRWGNGTSVPSRFTADRLMSKIQSVLQKVAV